MSQKILPIRTWECDSFCLHSLISSECESNFRLAKRNSPVLVDYLHIPVNFVCSERTRCSGVKWLCVLLKRLSYPCRYFDMIPTFTRAVPELCMISNTVFDWICENHGFRLTSWNQIFLSPVCLQRYADSISGKGCPLKNCFSFVDRTVRPVCRPGMNHRIVYNGHKLVHGLKFQSVALPNGLTANLGFNKKCCLICFLNTLQDFISLIFDCNEFHISTLF